MPSRLDEFHTRIGYMFGKRETLELRHTLLHYTLHGLPPEHHAKQRERLRTTCKGPIRLARLPVLLAPSEGEFLSCPECDEEALDNFGFTYVHRRSVAPLVNVCSTHFCLLRPSVRQGLLFDGFCRQTPSTSQMRAAVEFAVRSTSCVDDSDVDSDYSKAGVKRELRRSDWLGENDRFRLRELVKDFQRFFEGRFHDLRLEVLVSTADYIEAAIRALVREDRAAHTVWCILLKWFAQQCECSKPTTYARKSRAPVPLTEDRVRVALSVHRIASSAAQALGTSTHQLTLFCRTAGIPVDSRPSRLDDVLLDVIQVQLASGLHPQAVARYTGVSLTSVYRVLAATPATELPQRRAAAQATAEAKQQWLSQLEANSTVTLSALRGALPATYATLYRNAREWLQEHKPVKQTHRGARGRGRPAIALRALHAAIDSAVVNLQPSNGPPVRRSCYRIREVVGVSHYALQSSAERRALDDATETRDEHVAARVNWALTRGYVGRRDGWRLARAVTLRPATLMRWHREQKDKVGD
jgi:transposase